MRQLLDEAKSRLAAAPITDSDAAQKTYANMEFIERCLSEYYASCYYSLGLRESAKVEALQKRLNELEHMASEAIVPQIEKPTNVPSSAARVVRQRFKESASSAATSESPQEGNRHRKEHDQLTLDLLHMARRLKQNNLALQDLVQTDKKAKLLPDLLIFRSWMRLK